jgi:mannose-6-phosphate isomerase
MQLQKLEPSFHERVWGSTQLEPWFPNSSSKIGEVWYEGPEGYAAEVPLVKFIFTTDKLSVQVHPDDTYARTHHDSPGKTEMWHVLAAKPGAKIAAGFRESITKEHARRAALSGEIEDLLQWHEAAAGDTFFIPAGTVHAIGAGLTICEIQQRSDITYRLFDYGRPRELHLEHGLSVADLGPRPVRTQLPVSCEYFAVFSAKAPARNHIPGPHLLIVLQGEGTIGNKGARAGDVLHVLNRGLDTLPIQGNIDLLTVYIPGDTEHP